MSLPPDTPVWLELLLRFMALSLLSVGGAMAAAPEMHRMLVREHGWLSEADFTGAVALAQSAPGPNVLFVAVLGWNVAGLPGAMAALTGILLPSTLLTLQFSRWGRARPDSRAVQAFTGGMAPITVGLLLATGLLIARGSDSSAAAAALTLLAALVAWRTKLAPIWLVGAGALIGALGGV